MHKFRFPHKTAFVLAALLCTLLTGFSNVRAEGYQVSPNLGNQELYISPNYQVSADGRYAVYQIDTNDADYNQFSQLFSVNLATKERRALTPVFSSAEGKTLNSYKITPNGQYVVYIASLEAASRFELYSIPIAATSQSQRKNVGNIPATSQADIFDFDISPNSQHVVYEFSEENAAGEDFRILYRVAPTGGTVTQLTPRVADGEAENPIFAPDSSRIVYRYDAPNGDNTQYLSVALNGTGRKFLTDNTTGGAEPSITSDSQRFVFTGNSPSGEVQLYSITLAGGGARQQLSKNGEEVYNFTFANGYAVIVYAFRPTSGEGYNPNSFGFVAADKSYESVSYNTGKDINSYNFDVSPDNRSVIYKAAAESFGPEQLYSLTYQNGTPLDQQLSIAAVGQASFNSVEDFKIAPNSQRVVFRATQGTAGSPDLFSVAISNNPAAVKLNNLPNESGTSGDYFGVNSYFITPNSGRVIFTYPPSDGAAFDLYTNAITGGAPSAPFATRANDDDFGSGRVFLSPDARRVVYTKSVFDEETFTSSTTLWTALVPQ